MLISKDCKIDQCTSKDHFKESLKEILFNGKSLIATDGHILSIVEPIEIHETDKPGMIPVKAFKEALKTGQLNVNGSIKVGDTTFKSELKPSDYPDYERVLPQFKKTIIKLAINPQLLQRLANALGSKDKIVLEFGSETFKDSGEFLYPCGPIKASNIVNDNTGIIMPLTV